MKDQRDLKCSSLQIFCVQRYKARTQVSWPLIMKTAKNLKNDILF